MQLEFLGYDRISGRVSILNLHKLKSSASEMQMAQDYAIVPRMLEMLFNGIIQPYGKTPNFADPDVHDLYLLLVQRDAKGALNLQNMWNECFVKYNSLSQNPFFNIELLNR